MRYTPYVHKESLRPLLFFRRDLLPPVIQGIVLNDRFDLSHWVRTEHLTLSPNRPRIQGTARFWPVYPAKARDLGIDVPDRTQRDDGFWSTTVHYLVEHYEDSGCDGHTDMYLRGYILLSEAQFNDLANTDFELDVDVWAE